MGLGGTAPWHARIRTPTTSPTTRWSAITRPAPRCCGAPSASCSCSAASPSCCSPSASSITSAGTAASNGAAVRRRACARLRSRRRRPPRSSSWWSPRLLFLAQVLIGGAARALSRRAGRLLRLRSVGLCFPSNLLRTWHLQTMIFWVATSYVAGALFVASALGGGDPKGQRPLVHVLFWAVVRGCRRQPARPVGRASRICSATCGSGSAIRAGSIWRSGASGRSCSRWGLLFWFWLVCRAVAAGSAQPRAEAVRRLLPDRGLRDSVLLFARVLLRRQDQLLDRRRVAVLDHPSLGRGLLRVLRHGDRRGHPVPARPGPAHHGDPRDLSRCHPLLRRRTDRHRASLVLHRPDRARHGARRHVLRARGRARSRCSRSTRGTSTSSRAATATRPSGIAGRSTS